MFVQSAKFVENHSGNISNISIYGQDSNPTTWKMAQMNLAIRGIEPDLSTYAADTFLDDRHPTLRADYIMANPPFNLSDWGADKLKEDVRWQYGMPPAGNGENDISELGFSKSSTKKMPAGTVLFSSRAPIGYIAIAQNELTTNQGFKSVIPNKNIGTSYVYFLLKNLLPAIEGMASGSTFKEISGAGMKSVPTVMPDVDTIQLFNNFCEPIFKEQEVLEAENRRLSALRDLLLPKLMSGEIDIPSLDI